MALKLRFASGAENLNPALSSIASIKGHLKNNLNCQKIGQVYKKSKKILVQRKCENLALITYDDREVDVEYIYDMDLETYEIFIDPDETQNEGYLIYKI